MIEWSNISTTCFDLLHSSTSRLPNPKAIQPIPRHRLSLSICNLECRANTMASVTAFKLQSRGPSQYHGIGYRYQIAISRAEPIPRHRLPLSNCNLEGQANTTASIIAFKLQSRGAQQGRHMYSILKRFVNYPTELIRLFLDFSQESKETIRTASFMFSTDQENGQTL